MKTTTIYSNIKKCALLLLIGISTNFSFAQTCDLTVISPSPSAVCPGTVVDLSATATIIGANQSFNFNIGSLPSGWSVAGGASFSSPCGAGPDGSHFWASTAGSGVPFIQTAAFDVCTGGSIIFDMRYAVQAGASPCEGPDEPDEGVSIQYSINGGANWVEFVYYHPNGSILASNPGGNTPTISGATPFTTWGTYSVAIPPAAATTNTIFRWIQTNSSGTCCDNWGIDNIFINAGPCLNANIDWSTGDQNIANISPTITSDTCITADVYDNLGNYLCTSDPFCFTVFDPNIDAGPDQTLVCQGGNATVTASGGSSFTWDNGVIDGVPFTSPLGTTTYTVSGIDPNGCPATDQVDISVIVGTPPPLDAGLDQTICLGDNTTLTATGATNIVWANGGANGQTVSPATTTTYIVTGGDGTCTVDDAITITVVDPITPTFDAIPDVCLGAAAPTLPTTSTNGITGTWSGAVSTATAGTFNFTFTPTGTSCNPTTQMSVTVAPINIVDAGIDQTVCEGTPVTLTATGAPAYAWNYPITNGVPFTPPAGSTIEFIVTGSGGSGCSNSDTVYVTVVSTPTVDAGLDQTICAGQSVNLTATGATSYVWNIGGANGQSVTPLVTTTYDVTGTVSGCPASDNVTITVNPLTVPEFNPTANICQGATAPVPPSSSLNDVPGTWSPATINTSTAGTFNYTFTPNDVICNTTVQVAVTIDPLPVVDAGTYSSVCIDAGSIALVGSPAGGVFSGTGVTGNNFAPSSGTQTVTYTYTDANGCTNTDNQQITIFNLPIVNAGSDITLCEGESVTLSGSGATSYTWNNGVTNNQSFTPAVGPVVYTVTGTDANGCVGTDAVSVTVVDMPDAEAIPDVTSGFPGLTVNFTNNSSITPNYLWSFGDGGTGITTNVGTTPSNTYGAPGTYTMILEATNGTCSDFDTVQIIVMEYPEPLIEVPNVFTPNNDGSNEFFFINTENTKSIQYIIVNRWGNLIFEDEGPNPLWNGNTASGKPVEEGVYFIKYVVIGLNDQTYTGHGSVTLIRN